MALYFAGVQPVHQLAVTQFDRVQVASAGHIVTGFFDDLRTHRMLNAEPLFSQHLIRLHLWALNAGKLQLLFGIRHF